MQLNPTIPENVDIERNISQLSMNQEENTTHCCGTIKQVIKTIWKRSQGIYTHIGTLIEGHTNRHVRNLLRISIAGGLSVIGGLLSSEQHIIAIIGIWAIIFGSILSGVANGFSTILAWENAVDPKILDLQRQVSALANSVALLPHFP